MYDYTRLCTCIHSYKHSHCTDLDESVRICTTYATLSQASNIPHRIIRISQTIKDFVHACMKDLHSKQCQRRFRAVDPSFERNNWKVCQRLPTVLVAVERGVIRRGCHKRPRFGAASGCMQSECQISKVTAWYLSSIYIHAPFYSNTDGYIKLQILIQGHSVVSVKHTHPCTGISEHGRLRIIMNTCIYGYGHP
jgi:hypothetical protein